MNHTNYITGYDFLSKEMGWRGFCLAVKSLLDARFGLAVGEIDQMYHTN
jgi:hypothetical protein